MVLRLINFVTLIAFFNTILGCSSVMKLPAEQAIRHAEHDIQAVGLRDAYPLEIKLKNVAQVHVTKIRGDTEGGSEQDTIPGDQVEEVFGGATTILINRVVLRSGEEIALEKRESFYDQWYDVIRVAGSEIVFDSVGGHLDTSDSLIYGRIQNGDSARIKLEDVAYVRLRKPDSGKTALLVGGILTVIAGIGVIFLAAIHDQEN